MFAQFYWYIAIGLLLTIFTDVFPGNMLSNFYTIVVVSIIILIWLMVFNSGQSKIIENGIELTEEGVTYISYGAKLTIKWSSFSGCSIKNHFPRIILLKSFDGKNIEFSYYMFSSDQRSELFDYLAVK